MKAVEAVGWWKNDDYILAIDNISVEIGGVRKEGTDLPATLCSASGQCDISANMTLQYDESAVNTSQSPYLQITEFTNHCNLQWI